jgi:hypothetical protein
MGYVTPDAAAREYGVSIRFTGRADELVRLPEQWVIDEAATRALRQAHHLPSDEPVERDMRPREHGGPIG